MNVPDMNDHEVEALISEIQSSSKYRHLGIPKDTILDLIIQESSKYKRYKELRQAVKAKLHRVVAPYLGDPDYQQAQQELEDAFLGTPQNVLDFCRTILGSHASTRERLDHMELFYERIFQLTGLPDSIIDLACGLNPFALPWMHLPVNSNYFAYDLHQPRVQLVNRFLELSQQPGSAIYGDILVQPPQLQADVAFFFKEAHRFDQRHRGSNRLFFEQLRARYLVVSLPASSLTGRHDKVAQHERLVNEAITGHDWPIQHFQIENELVFIIHKII